MDTLIDHSIKIIAHCPNVWGNLEATFTFVPISNCPNLILLKRIIYDEDGIVILKYEKVIIEKLFIQDLVCLKEPKRYMPGTDFPFIEIDLENIFFAQKKEHLK